MTRTMAAEVVFIEDARGDLWRARLLAPDQATGMILNRPVRTRSTATILTIREVRYPAVPAWGRPERTVYEWTTPGTTHPGGNRHESADTISEAQERVTKWAARRFRTEVQA